MTDLLSHPPTVILPLARAHSPIYLFGGFTKGLRDTLEDLGVWPRITRVGKQAVTTPPGNVIVTRDWSLQRLLGEDLRVHRVLGSVLTDGTRVIFVADERVGSQQWGAWLSAIDGDGRRLELLPEMCAGCGQRWWWTRDERGVGWCRECAP